MSKITVSREEIFQQIAKMFDEQIEHGIVNSYRRTNDGFEYEFPAPVISGACIENLVVNEDLTISDMDYEPQTIEAWIKDQKDCQGF